MGHRSRPPTAPFKSLTPNLCCPPPGALLKEAIDDLEWPNGPVVLSMQRDPRRITMRATGTSGSLEVSAIPRMAHMRDRAAPRPLRERLFGPLRAASNCVVGL
jgi:hypothetical protein